MTGRFVDTRSSNFLLPCHGRPGDPAIRSIRGRGPGGGGGGPASAAKSFFEHFDWSSFRNLAVLMTVRT